MDLKIQPIWDFSGYLGFYFFIFDCPLNLLKVEFTDNLFDFMMTKHFLKKMLLIKLSVVFEIKMFHFMYCSSESVAWNPDDHHGVIRFIPASPSRWWRHFRDFPTFLGFILFHGVRGPRESEKQARQLLGNS